MLASKARRGLRARVRPDQQSTHGAVEAAIKLSKDGISGTWSDRIRQSIDSTTDRHCEETAMETGE